MDDRPPLEFANRVIRRFVTNLFGEDAIVPPQDYLVLRTVFRRLGGSWEKVAAGDTKQVSLVIQVVRAWGNVKKMKKVELGY
jgi:hypothetical protein